MKREKKAPPEEVEAEVAGLIATLHDTERRLEELTGGEVDSVSGGSGGPFLLRRAQEELRASDAVRQAAILNALPAHIALLDAAGVIVSVNDAWRQFATDNQLEGPAFGIGVNYLTLCDRVRGGNGVEARGAAEGIRAVLGGAPSFSLEYPCHSLTERRWFQMTGAPLARAGGHGVVVMHVNITERKRAEIALRESQATLSAAQHIGHFGSWEVDLHDESAEETNTLRWSDEMFRIAGYEPGAVEVTNEFFFSRIPPEEHALIRQGVAAAIRKQEPYALVHRLIRADGGICFLEELAKIFYDEKTGRAVKIIGTAHDITERMQAEAAFAALSEKTARRERMLTTALSHLHDFAYVYDRAGRFVFANQPLLNLWGLTLEQVVGKDFFELGYPADLARRLQGQVQEVFQTKKSLTDETPYTSPGGRNGFYEYIFSPAFGTDGTVEFVVGSTRDVTERNQAEAALRDSNEKFHQLADNISDAFWIRSPDFSEVQYVSPAFEEIWGRSVESLRADPQAWSSFIFAEDRARVTAAFDALTSGGPSLDIEYRIVRPAGEIRWVRVRGSQIRNADDHLIRHIGIVSDITERKQAETELQWKTAFLEAQVASSIDGILVVDEHGKKSLQNQRMADLFGIPQHVADNREDSLQLAWVTGATTHPRQFAEKVAYLNSHRDEISRDEIELKSGTTLDRYSAPVIGRDGKYYGRIWTFRDITERKRSMEALRASEQRFRALFDQAAVGVAQAEAITGRFVQVNQRFADIVGRSREELEHLTFAAITHPRDGAFDQEMMRRLIGGKIREYAREKRYVRPDGSNVWVTLTVSAMWAPGEAPGLCIAVVQDITERKRLDEHFLQAQKMEALGQFSGGVAHDFNNILATISGYTELSRLILKDNPDVREYLDAVLKATGRATDLVKQILTFSRQQPQERQVIPLQRVVEESIKLLRATIPSTITFDTSVAANAPTVLANANQVHQVLTNLGVNAWQAMQDRPGCLRIKLEKWVVDEAQAAVQPRLRPGGYARVSVSDTGCGMEAATLRRIFEPFFTTKPVGQGTGLGLAVVHGIMDAHDGAVTVYSQPGEGTVFHLYFPAHAGETTVSAIDEGPMPRGQGEAVLVVDDEEAIASMIQQALTRLNYTAEFATDPAAALARVQADPAHFKLVLSDQTMPGMTGLVLATRLREIRPDLPLILMTGFSASLTPERIEKAGVREVLFKPLTVQLLASAVRAALAENPLAPP